MKVKVKRQDAKEKRKKKYPTKDIDLAIAFAKKLYSELGELSCAIILFGSSFRDKPKKQGHDLDIMVLIDDVRIKMTPEIIETYRIIIEKTIAEVAKDRLHIQVTHLTNWWNYVRTGDPIAINILRDGFALVDTGFFDPLQALLDRGAIRPSAEAIWTYMNMAPAALFRGDNHIINATMDMYWAVIDAAHAALMSVGAIPPSPHDVADMLRERFVKKGKLDEKYAKTMETFYQLSKDIIYRKIKTVSGKDYDEYSKLAREFVDKMKKIIENKK